LLFTDAATSAKMHLAVGAFVCLQQKNVLDYSHYSQEDLHAAIQEKIIYQVYSSKKATWSEIKNVVDALILLHKNSNVTHKVEIYTDCQNLCDLLGRRKAKLQRNNFITRAGKILQHAELYQELYSIAEKFQIRTFKIKGHGAYSDRVTIEERIFSILDKMSRWKLRSLGNNSGL
jgi:ribonuclease HI